MEALGGGGHRTVAGAQLQGMTIEEAKAAILDKALEALHSAEKRRNNNESSIVRRCKKSW